MVYIDSTGKIQSSRGFIGTIKHWWAAFIAFIVLFFTTLNPANDHKSKGSGGTSGSLSTSGGRTIGRVKGPPKQGPNCMSGS